LRALDRIIGIAIAVAIFPGCGKVIRAKLERCCDPGIGLPVRGREHEGSSRAEAEDFEETTPGRVRTRPLLSRVFRFVSFSLDFIAHRLISLRSVLILPDKQPILARDGGKCQMNLS
jgi:hypothetical protein